MRTGKNAHTLARLYHDATSRVLEDHHTAPADARALVPVLEKLLAARGGTVDACVARFCAAERLRLAKNAGAADSAAAAADLAAEAAPAPAPADDDDDGGFDDLHALHKEARKRDKHSHNHGVANARNMAIAKRNGQRQAHANAAAPR